MKKGADLTKSIVKSAPKALIQIFNKLLLKVYHGMKFLRIQQLAFDKPKEVFYHGVVQTVSFAAHALPEVERHAP